MSCIYSTVVLKRALTPTQFTVLFFEALLTDGCGQLGVCLFSAARRKHQSKVNEVKWLLTLLVSAKQTPSSCIR